MKALILNGSPRKKGVTLQMLNHMKNVLEKKMDVEQINVYEKSIKPCIGCEKCRPDKQCILPEDDAQLIAKKIDEAELLVLSSPTYWGNITGPLKTLIDRCVTTFEYIDGHSIPKKNQKGKSSIIITASNAPFIYNLQMSQSRGAVNAMKTILKAGGFSIKGIINVANSRNYANKKHRVEKKIERIANKIKVK